MPWLPHLLFDRSPHSGIICAMRPGSTVWLPPASGGIDGETLANAECRAYQTGDIVER